MVKLIVLTILIDNNTLTVSENLELFWSTTIHPYNIQKIFIKKFEHKFQFHLLSVELKTWEILNPHSRFQYVC
jgi:hypothetical protein